MDTNLTSLGDAAYPIPYAARLVGLDAHTARRWTRGYTYRRSGEPVSAAPIAQLAPDPLSGLRALTFEQLLTLRLVRAFRDQGLALQTIKKAAQVAVQRYGVDNPFISRAFRTDGRDVFIDLVERGNVSGKERVLVNALSGQQQFRAVVEPSLFRDVVFIADAPGEWFPLGKARSVVIRPDRAFGAPHIDGSGLRTDVLAEAVAAEGGGEAAMSTVANWFGIDSTRVYDAVEAEAGWRPRKAA